MIVQGDLSPGQQIVQEDLAERIGVSRTPLRKAIATLTQENFLEMNSRGVAFVRSFNEEELTSIWEIRAVLEGLVCRLVSRRAKPQHIAYLRSLITSAAEQTTDEDWSAYRKADVEFHSYLAEVLGDPLLTNMLDSFQILSLTLAQGLLRPPTETLPEHLEILDALSEHDADRAEHAMVKHIRTSIQHVRTSKKIGLALPSNFMNVVDEEVSTLLDELQETVVVLRADGSDSIILHHVEGRRTLRVAVSPNERFPLHATAAGKVLLAWKDRIDPNQVLDSETLERLTTDSLAAGQDLRDELANVQANGYAIEEEEYEVGVSSIAAPIWTKDRVIAALVVLIPASRLNAEKQQHISSMIVECADSISRQIYGTPVHSEPEA